MANAIHIYSWDDAPDHLREALRPLLTEGRIPRWIAHVEQSEKPPSYLLAYLTMAWIDSFADGWAKVYLCQLPDGSEARVGVEQKL